MKIILKIGKSVHENAALYYEQAKEARKKIEGLEKAIEETKKEIEKEKKREKEDKKLVKVKKEKRWYEKFRWFNTSGEKLAVGGSSAQQNDLVFSRHMDDNDLFFHADIQGATALILKEGKNANDAELLECAQFAASFSNAWKNSNAAVDVYCVGKEHLAKHAQGGYIPTGAFAIKGERRWFRSTKLCLRLQVTDGTVIVIPELHSKKKDSDVILYPAASGKEKGELAKVLSKRLGIHPDELLQILPSGRTKTK